MSDKQTDFLFLKKFYLFSKAFYLILIYESIIHDPYHVLPLLKTAEDIVSA